MFPKLNKAVMVSIGAAVSVILAVTGKALNLVGVFQIIGASFGPICGSMAADYLLSGCKWSGPRKGVNLAGYISWAVGFVVAILPTIGIPFLVANEKFSFINPAPVIAFVIGFVLYIILVKKGLQPPVVEMAAAPAKSAPQEAPTEETAGEEKKD
jgi:cytosine permease